jgi:gas vesicle protein
MEDLLKYQQMLSGAEQAYQGQLESFEQQEEKKKGIKTVEQQGGLLGLFEGKKRLIDLVKKKLNTKIDDLTEKAKEKIAELKDKALDTAQKVKDRAQEVKENVIEQVQEATQPEEIAPVVEGLQHIREGDTMAEVINDSNKFNEYVKGVDDPINDYLFTSMNRDITNDTHIEEMRNTLKGILDNPQDEDQEYLAQGFRDNILYPRQEAIQAEQQEFISPEITGGLRGDSTIARALREPSGQIGQEVQLQAPDVPTGQIGEEVQNIGQQAGEIAETTGDIVRQGVSEAGEAVSQIGKSVGKEIGESVGEGLGEELAGESSLLAVPGVGEILAPLAFIGSAVAAIFGHKKQPRGPVMSGVSSQFGG